MFSFLFLSMSLMFYISNEERFVQNVVIMRVSIDSRTLPPPHTHVFFFYVKLFAINFCAYGDIFQFLLFPP